MRGKAKEDRIGLALELMQTPLAITKGIAHRFNVQSQSHRDLRYSVGIRNSTPYCTCQDFFLHGQPCKHILAALAPAAVAAILQFRWSTDADELSLVARHHAEALKGLAPVFRELARAEYRAAQQRLNQRAAIAA